MKVIKFLVAFAMVASASASQAAHLSLAITGAFDGPLDGGEPKVVELYALEDIPDLSRWAVGLANNGGGSDGPESVLSGSVTAGTFIYIIDDNSDSPAFEEFNTYFAGQIPAGALLFDSNAGSNGGGAATNGDDAIEIFFDGDNDAGGDPNVGTGFEVVGDTFGDINTDGTGEPWEYLDGWAYRVSGTSPTAPGGVFTLSDFTYSGINVNDGKDTNVDPAAFPIGTFNPVPEPSSVVMLLMAACGVGAVGLRTRLG